MRGELCSSLMKCSAMSAAYESVQNWSVQHIYSHESVIKVEITGFNVIKSLMNLFMRWVTEPRSPLGRKIGAILHADPEQSNDARYRFLHVVDYISGMTDSYALQTYGSLFGTGNMAFS